MTERRASTITILTLLCCVLVAAGASLFTTPVLADDYRPVTREWNISAPGANTDALTDISWEAEDTCRVSVQVATSSIVNLMVKRGAVEKALGLNSNTALVAGALYQFDVTGMKYGDTVNFQVETNGVIDKLDVGALKATR